MKQGLFLLVLPALLAGCSQSTEVSRQPTDAELQAASQKRAAAVEERTDLTPEQKAGLARYQSGGQAAGPGAPPK